MLSAKLLPGGDVGVRDARYGVGPGICVVTGFSVAARMDNLRGVERASELRTSSGPVMSRSWKPGKSMTAMWFGGVEAILCIFMRIAQGNL